MIPKPLHTKRLHADFIAQCDEMAKSKSMAVCRIKMCMIFCRLALAEGWDFDREIHPVTDVAFETDRNARGEDVGMGVYTYLAQYQG